MYDTYLLTYLPILLYDADEEVIAIGELPADLKHLDSTELRQLNNDGHDGVPINVDSSLTSMSSVTMTSYDDRQVRRHSAKGKVRGQGQGRRLEVAMV